MIAVFLLDRLEESPISTRPPPVRATSNLVEAFNVVILSQLIPPEPVSKAAFLLKFLVCSTDDSN